MDLLPLPAFNDNYIWVARCDDGPALVVDPGRADPVLAAMAQGLRPGAILLTHHHHDHVGGVAALLAQLPGLPVFAPEDPRIDLASHRVGAGDAVRSGDWCLNVAAVPGHTVSHIAFHGHGLLFCGDTLFSLGCGRLFEGSPAQMLDSLDRLAALPDETLVCCGHEYTVANAAFARVVDPDNPALARRCEEAIAMRQSGRPTLPTTIAAERAANPFLRIDAPAIIDAVTTRLGCAPSGRVETFAGLRRWKDGFAA